MKFSITILGSSAAIPTTKRHLSAQVVNVHEHFFLIDCGEGTQLQLRNNQIKLSKINHIFLSHLHGDHFFGIFGLLSTLNLLGRTNTLHIYSHKNIINCLDTIFEEKDDYTFNQKRTKKEYYTEYINLGFPVIIHLLNIRRTEVIFETNFLQILSLPLNHRIATNGFIFKEIITQKNMRKEALAEYNIPIKEIHKIKNGADLVKDDGTIIPNDKLTFPLPCPRSFAYCSDTRYEEKIIPDIKNIDLLYHEATFKDDKKDEALKTGHSTSVQAAKIAYKAQVKKLLLGHFSSRYKNIEENIAEAQTIFPNSYEALENKTYPIEFNK